MNLLNTVKRSLVWVGKFRGSDAGSRRTTGRVSLSLESLDGRCLPAAGLPTPGKMVAADIGAIKHDPVADAIPIKHAPTSAELVAEDTGLQRKHDPS